MKPQILYLYFYFYDVQSYYAYLVHDINREKFNTDISGVLHNLTQHRNTASHYEDKRDKKKASRGQ